MHLCYQILPPPIAGDQQYTCVCGCVQGWEKLFLEVLEATVACFCRLGDDVAEIEERSQGHLNKPTRRRTRKFLDTASAKASSIKRSCT